MTFTADWTTDRVSGTWLPFVQQFIGREKMYALEIGAYEGRSTVWMLENILTDPTSRIVVIDPFLGGSVPDLPNEYLTAFVENTLPYQKQVRILQAKSAEIDAHTLYPFARNGFELVYIDASHMPFETVYEARLAWDVTNKGSVIIFDDYSGSLKEAVDEWLKPHLVSERAAILHEDYQFIIKRV